MNATFQTGDLRVTMAYSATFLSMTIISMIGFEVIGRKFPLKQYIIYYSLFFPITLIISSLGYGFTTMAMPFSIATATPLIHAFINIHFIDRKTTTRMQKILGVVYLITGIHCINFALFRMDPEAQLWGWLVAYTIYDMLAILLPSIALEEANMSENDRLHRLVDARTSELNISMKENEQLLKVVLHDISNPLMVLKFYLSSMKPNVVVDESRLNKVKKSQSIIEDVLAKIRNIYSHNGNKNKMTLNPVLLEDCFNEVAFIFDLALQAKNVSLVFKNHLIPGTKVLADKTSLTHSVLSNLVSNALKFSTPNSEIAVVAKEEAGSIILVVIDNGPGIPEDIIQSIIDECGSVVSSTGTFGERGHGFGLSIVKSFINSYGGQIEFESKQQMIYPEEHGTSIRITLEKAPTLLS
ncbi:MAG: HAMP domain-containing histidine kinase [Bacteriovorax sp.]|nr:HAMP domain-containing histidine kinase [Bacteriovorax sp.]